MSTDYEPDPEISVLALIAEAMNALDPVAAERVAHWVFDRYTVPTNGAGAPSVESPS